MYYFVTDTRDGTTSMDIGFVSDGATVSTGFKLTYTIDPGGDVWCYDNCDQCSQLYDFHFHVFKIRNFKEREI